ncbi:MAG: hypothetical protein ACRDTT_35150, partial [Pseudonocardiaceae bacterium]
VHQDRPALRAEQVARRVARSLVADRTPLRVFPKGSQRLTDWNKSLRRQMRVGKVLTTKS